jgi:hypothetical protein
MAGKSYFCAVIPSAADWASPILLVIALDV